MRSLLSKVFYALFSLGYHLLLLHRLSRFCLLKVPLCGGQLSSIVRHIMRVYTSCDISPKAVIGKNWNLPHPLGIVIGDGVVIGDNVMIFQRVTLGSHGKKGIPMEYPVIENNVRIYPNSTIIGGVKIGEGAIIGAHSLVLKDVPAGKTAVGAPAHILETD